MSDELSNETNLVQQRENRRNLAKMRSKLVTSGQVGKKLDLTPPSAQKRPLRIWPFVAVLGLVLAGMNFALHTQQDKIVSAMGGSAKSSARLQPPPGLSLDEQARFWCYATYDYDKLKARFKLPRGVVYDKKEARANLDRMLADDLGREVRTEIFAYQQLHPDPVAPVKPIAKAKPVGKGK
jgi:hypothetical protein